MEPGEEEIRNLDFLKEKIRSLLDREEELNNNLSRLQAEFERLEIQGREVHQLQIVNIDQIKSTIRSLNIILQQKIDYSSAANRLDKQCNLMFSKKSKSKKSKSKKSKPKKSKPKKSKPKKSKHN
jgi:conjugal transfer/entry exclusion protein